MIHTYYLEIQECVFHKIKVIFLSPLGHLIRVSLAAVYTPVYVPLFDQSSFAGGYLLLSCRTMTCQFVRSYRLRCVVVHGSGATTLPRPWFATASSCHFLAGDSNWLCHSSVGFAPSIRRRLRWLHPIVSPAPQLRTWGLCLEAKSHYQPSVPNRGSGFISLL